MDINANQPETLLNQGIVVSRQGKYVEAIGYFQKVIDLDPNESDAYWNITQIYVSTKGYNQALLYLDKYMILNKDDEEAQELRVTLEREMTDSRTPITKNTSKRETTT